MTTMALRDILSALVLLATPLAASAADQSSDPDWPCVQRKVPELTVGQMWSGPPPQGDWRDDPEIARLAGIIAARRTTLDEVGTLAKDYAASLPEAERPARMALFSPAFSIGSTPNGGEVIGGISRYAHKQVRLSDLVKAEEAEVATLKAAPEPDLDKVEEAQDKLNWDIRIFRERSQSLTYVCETPTLLEQRAFAIARLLAGNA